MAIAKPVQQVFHPVSQARNGFKSDSAGGSFERVGRSTNVTQCGHVTRINAQPIEAVVDVPHVLVSFFAENLDEFFRHVAASPELTQHFIDVGVGRHDYSLSL